MKHIKAYNEGVVENKRSLNKFANKFFSFIKDAIKSSDIKIESKDSPMLSSVCEFNRNGKLMGKAEVSLHGWRLDITFQLFPRYSKDIFKYLGGNVILDTTYYEQLGQSMIEEFEKKLNIEEYKKYLANQTGKRFGL